MKRICSLVLTLAVLCTGISALAADAGMGRIMGTLQKKSGEPMANGTLFLFYEKSGPPPAPEKYWRVPDEIVPLDANGKFVAEVRPGTYYLGAIKRIAGEELGAPNEGDYFLANRDEKGNLRKYTVKAGETKDIGTLAQGKPFKREKAAAKGSVTAIEGTVLDEGGKPVAGALVFAFVSPTMVGKPLFASERTGRDGKYLLRVDEGGTYYLKSREVYGGGAPKAGEIIGGYGEKEPAPVKVEAGKTVKGIDLNVIHFKGRGPNQ
ncbi:hypothetical protein GEOBC_01753 [Geobacteraceae bacterium]|nr:hypothetical protein GEOBC_01753 [Geobacteraceae bacterium]